MLTRMVVAGQFMMAAMPQAERGNRCVTFGGGYPVMSFVVYIIASASETSAWLMDSLFSCSIAARLHGFEHSVML